MARVLSGRFGTLRNWGRFYYSTISAGIYGQNFVKLLPYTLAGFDPTTHSSILLGGWRRLYLRTKPT
jgi:hypothetical protein